jgi:hypothetical protein
VRGWFAGVAASTVALAAGCTSSLRQLTSWYNGPKNLSWMTGWRSHTVPAAYAAGYAMQLVVFSNDAPTQVSTKYARRRAVDVRALRRGVEGL